MKRTSIAIAAACAVALMAAGCANGWRTPDGSGTVEGIDVQVSAEAAGRLLEMPVDEGSVVVAGDTLALIDRTSHELRLKAARAALARARPTEFQFMTIARS